MSEFTDRLDSILSTVLRAWSVVRGRFDTSSPEGRSKERYRRVALTLLSSLAVRGISVPAALISIPLTLSYLGIERFGAWLTISSVVAMLGFLDLGISQGLLNAVAEADGRQDRVRARDAVSSGFFLLLGISATILVTFAISYPFVPWPRVFNVTSALASGESGPTAAVLVICFAFSLPLSVVRQVQLGFQEGFRNDIWQSLGTLLGLVALIVALWLHAGLPWLVVALVGAPQLATALNWFLQFRRSRAWLAPSWSAYRWLSARALMHRGIYFTGVNICAAVVVSADYLIIAHMLGSNFVTQYGVPARLFALSSILLSSVLAPLWPALTEALARGDYAWLRSTVDRTLWWGFIAAALPCAALVIFGRPVIRIWVGPEIQPRLSLLGGLAVWTVLSQLGYAVTTVLAAIDCLRFRWTITAIMTAVAFVLKFVFIQHFGLAGLAWAMSLAFFFLVFVPGLVFVMRFLDGIERGTVIDVRSLWIPRSGTTRDSGLWRWLGLLLWGWPKLLSRVLRLRPFRPIGRYIHARRRHSEARAQSGETRFFRNTAQLRALRRIALTFPAGSTIRFAVIGCSTGAELYSAVHALRSDKGHHEVQVIGIDISPEAVLTASRARYSATGAEASGVSTELMQAITECDGVFLRVRDEFRNGVSFQIADARDPELVAKVGRHDILFANNFLIHMPAPEAEECLANITRLLVPGGFLFISGVDLDIRTAVMRRAGLEPVTYDVESIHASDRLLSDGWPWRYWGLEPLDRRDPNWRARYASVFTVPHPPAGGPTSELCDARLAV